MLCAVWTGALPNRGRTKRKSLRGLLVHSPDLVRSIAFLCFHIAWSSRETAIAFSLFSEHYIFLIAAGRFVGSGPLVFLDWIIDSCARSWQNTGHLSFSLDF